MAEFREIARVEVPLLDGVVSGVVDYKGHSVDRSKSGGWKSASFIIGVEVAERFAFHGISANLITYLTEKLGQPTATAAENVNVWTGVAALSPLFGAFLADSYLGRYRTIIIASLLYILGLGLLTLSIVFPYSDCENVTNSTSCLTPTLQTIFFFVSLYLVAIAQGGHKPCVQAFGADQFDSEDPDECKAKSSFFNWWYFGICGGGTLSILIVLYIQENLSWGLGFGIPCISMGFAFLVFLLGTKTYRFSNNDEEERPFKRIGYVFVKAARNWQKKYSTLSIEDDMPHPHSQQFKFLNKALLSSDVSKEDGKVCTIREVEEAKVVLRLVPIWTTCLAYTIVFAQSNTLFTKQGVTMNCSINSSFKIPAASLQAFIGITIVIFIPIYDRIFVPVARAITHNPSGISMLQRIGTGIVLSIFSMLIASFVEMKRLDTALKYGLVDRPEETIPMHIWWLVPQYLLFGISDVFAIVGMQEFFYDQVPRELRSVGLSLYLSTIGIGSFLSSFLISIIEKITRGDGEGGWFSTNLNRAHLDYFYMLLACLSGVTLVAYMYFAKYYIYNQARI